MNGSYVVGKGLATEDGKLIVDSSTNPVQLENIDTQFFHDAPGVFVKEKYDPLTPNTNYNNVVKLTCDAMSSQYQDIQQTIPIPNNSVLQKVGGSLSWQPVGSALVTELDAAKLFSYPIGFLYFDEPGPGNPPLVLASITDGYITSLSFSKLTSVPETLQALANLGGFDNTKIVTSTSTGYQYQSFQSFLSGLLLAFYNLGTPTISNTFPCTPTYTSPTSLSWQTLPVLGSLLSTLNTQSPQYIITANMQSNSINGDRLLDMSVDFSKISNPSAALSLVQGLNTSPTTGQIMKYNGTTLAWATDDTVTLNALLTALNSQTVVNLTQIQSNATATKLFLQSISGVQSYNQVSYSDLQNVPAKLTNFVNATQTTNYYLKATDNTSGVAWAAFPSIPSQTQPKSFWVNNAAGTLTYVTGTPGQLLSFDASSVPYAINQSTLSIATTQLTGTISLSQILGSSGPIKVLSSTNFANSWIDLYFSNINGTVDILQLPSGTNGQILSCNGTNAQYINQSALSIGYSQLTSVPTQLTSLVSAGWGTNGQYLQTNGSNTLSWATFTLSNLNQLPQQTNMGFIGVNQGGNTSAKNMTWISAGNPSSDQLYYAKFASSNNSTWSTLTGTNGNGGILTFRQDGSLQNLKGNNTQIYYPYLVYNTVTQQPEWQNANGTQTQYISAQNKFENLKHRSIENSTGWDLQYSNINASGNNKWTGFVFQRPDPNNNFNKVFLGLYTTSGDVVQTTSQSWSLHTQSGLDCIGSTFTQRGCVVMPRAF